MRFRPVTSHALLDSGVARDPKAQRTQTVNAMADFLMAHNAYLVERDAMRAMVGHFRPWEIVELAPEAMAVANEIMIVSREMGAS